MTKLYKLTNSKWETRGPTKWGPNVTHGPTSGKGDLCGPGWLHAYTSLELALIMNAMHADIKDFVAWIADGTVEKSDRGLKVGTTMLTTIRIVKPPAVTTEHRVRFAIFCAIAVFDAPKFTAWATRWLSGEERMTAEAVAAEAVAAWAAAWAAWAAVVSEKLNKPINFDKLAKKAIYGEKK